MRIAWLLFFVGFLFVSSVFAQRDAPVWESYLPRVSIYHDTLEGKAALTIDFLFKKNGGPYEHTEHQAYVLAYLKKDEEQILKLAADAQLVNKSNEKTKLFLDLLIEKKLVIPLDSQVAKINLPNGTTPSFPDVKGIAKRGSNGNLEASCFPFTFTFTYETFFQSVNKLGNFRAQHATIAGPSTWFNDKFKLLVFVPVNDSGHANKVSPRLRQTPDFANVMDYETALLYFKPLPYELSFKKYERDTLLVYIN